MASLIRKYKRESRLHIDSQNYCIYNLMIHPHFLLYLTTLLVFVGLTDTGMYSYWDIPLRCIDVCSILDLAVEALLDLRSRS